MSTSDFLEFLQKRQGLLEGVCVSGGEPTGDPGLEQLLKNIKALGFAVKLDTNGSRPAVLKKLLEQGLVDYVAMDVKNSRSKYPETVGCSCDVAAVEESLKLLIDGKLPYELRTTLVAQLHDNESMEAMGQWLAALVPGKKPAQLFLQSFSLQPSFQPGNYALCPCHESQGCFFSVEPHLSVIMSFTPAITHDILNGFQLFLLG